MKNIYKAKLLTLLPIIFFSVSGGPYGLEEIVSSVGPLNTLLLILLLPIVWTIPECMIVAELSSNYPLQGGYYKWVQMGLGRFWGFMEGWWSILYTLIDLSLYPILFTMYLKFFFPDLNFWTVYLIQILMIWSSALINILGIRIVGNMLTVFQALILIFFIVFVLVGFQHVSFNSICNLKTSYHFSTSQLLFGLSLAFWNFIGWDNGSTLLHEIENPEINYHYALFITIPIIVLFYFFPTLVGLSIHTEWHNWRFGEFSHIANAINQPVLAICLAIGGMITCLGLYNSLLLSSTRIFSTMALDKLMPGFFAKIHHKYNTPYLSIVFVSVIYTFLILVNFQKLIIYDVFFYLLAMFLEAVSLVILRKTLDRGKGNNTFVIPFGNLGMKFVVGLACFVILFMVSINVFNLNTSLSGWFLASSLLFSGIPVYVCLRNKG